MPSTSALVALCRPSEGPSSDSNRPHWMTMKVGWEFSFFLRWGMSCKNKVLFRYIFGGFYG